MTDAAKQTQASSDGDLIRRGDVLAIQMLGVTVTQIERAIRAIPKRDPLSDPRVVALVEAAQALGAMPEGYCFCSKDRIGDASKIHEPECRDLRAALRAIGGEA